MRREHNDAIKWLGLTATVLALLLIALAAGSEVLRAQGASADSDFVEYWAAGRLNATGANPYLRENLIPLQKEIGYIHEEPMAMWNPPWVLPLVMPFGLLPYGVARALWLLLQGGAIFFCARILWRLYGGAASTNWLAVLLSLVFVPTFFVLVAGQITPLVLLGLVLFLVCVERQRWWLAGLSTVLVAAKPHLLYLFFVALVLWSIEKRRWQILAGTVLGIGGLTALAAATNISVVSQYVAALQEPPYYWITPTLGALTRLIAGWDRYVLQFVPSLLGGLAFLALWLKRRHEWTWTEQLPALLLLSVATMAYGWVFDLVVLVPVLVVLALRSGEDKVARLGFLTLLLVIDLVAVYTHLAPSLQATWLVMRPGDTGGDGWGLAATITDRSRAWGAVVAPLVFAGYSMMSVRLQGAEQRECQRFGRAR